MKTNFEINILKKGDKVLFVNNNFIAVKRKKGVVDLIPIVIDDEGLIRVDEMSITTIGYGNNEVKSSITGEGIDMHFKTF